jgi:hypothetical protein
LADSRVTKEQKLEKNEFLAQPTLANAKPEVLTYPKKH